MNPDNDLVAAVRGSAAGVQLDIPVDDIKRRGRAIRSRRRLASGAAITAVAGAAAAGVVVATIPGPAAPNVQPRLAAWTVTTGPGDTVRVTIRQLADPAGLEQALRADGVPARVAFAGGTIYTNAPLPAGCVAPDISDAENAALQAKISPLDTSGPMHGIALTIHKSAIPDGIGIYLTVQMSSTSFGDGLDLVQATAQCTGS